MNTPVKNSKPTENVETDVAPPVSDLPAFSHSDFK